MKISDAEISSLLFDEQGADPATPGVGLWRIYIKADGAYLIDDAGVVTGPFGSAADLAAHLSDVEAHVASAIPIADAGGYFAGDNVEAALQELGAAGGGGGGAVDIPFKFSRRRGAGNYALTSTVFAPIDATNLGYLTFDLAVGDVVRLEFMAQGFHSGSQALALDFEVDQPTSPNTTASGGNDWGVVNVQATSVRARFHAISFFTATEAGVHGFRPIYKLSAATLTLANATSGTDESDIVFAAELLGTPLA